MYATRNRPKRLLGILLTLAMALALIPVFSITAEAAEITKVEITIPMPKEGDSIWDNCRAATVPAGAGYSLDTERPGTVNGVQYATYSTNASLTDSNKYSTARFTAGGKYYRRFCIKATAGNTLAEDVKVYVNGALAYSNNDNAIGIFYFTPTISIEIPGTATQMKVTSDTAKYNVPGGKPNAAFKDIDLSGAVSGGSGLYKFSAGGGFPYWLKVDTSGSAPVITSQYSGKYPPAERTAETATVLIEDLGTGKTEWLTVQVGAVSLNPGAPASALSLNVSGALTLPELKEGYAAADRERSLVNISNTGNKGTQGITISLSGADATAFQVATSGGSYPLWKNPGEGDVKADIAAGKNDNFSIRSAEGLKAGTYTATVNLTAANGGSASFTVTQTVKAAPAYEAYRLTVTNGTGSGLYVAGMSVRVTANAAPAGQAFDKWTNSEGLTLENAESAETFIKMPAHDLTITATYKVLPPDAYAVNVESGEGGTASTDKNSAKKDDTVTLTAIPAGLHSINGR